jgi:Zn finger protein HypA/HybF involved in hydrogenase expression
MSAIPIICRTDGRRFTVATVTEDLRCRCGSSDLDLDDRTASWSADQPMDTLREPATVKQRAKCSSCLTEHTISAVDPAQPMPACPSCGADTLSVAGPTLASRHTAVTEGSTVRLREDGRQGTVVATTPNGWGLTVEWEDGSTSDVSAIQVTTVASRTALQKNCPGGNRPPGEPPRGEWKQGQMAVCSHCKRYAPVKADGNMAKHILPKHMARRQAGIDVRRGTGDMEGRWVADVQVGEKTKSETGFDDQASAQAWAEQQEKKMKGASTEARRRTAYGEYGTSADLWVIRDQGGRVEILGGPFDDWIGAGGDQGAAAEALAAANPGSEIVSGEVLNDYEHRIASRTPRRQAGIMDYYYVAVHWRGDETMLREFSHQDLDRVIAEAERLAADPQTLRVNVFNMHGEKLVWTDRSGLIDQDPGGVTIPGEVLEQYRSDGPVASLRVRNDVPARRISMREAASRRNLTCGSCGHTWESRAQYRIACPKCGAEESVRQAVKVAQIARGVMATNPGMDRKEALRVARETVRRYPRVAGETR